MIDGSPADLATPRLVLEPLSVGHAAEMVAVLGDPSLYVFTGGEPPSFETLEDRYRYQVSGSGDPNELWLNWIVRRTDTAAPVGFVQATVLPDDGPSADIAWVIGVDHQGNGFATESARAMAQWLLARGVASLTAHIHPDHAASQAVARAVGLLATAEVDDDGEVVWASPSAAVLGGVNAAVDPGDPEVAARIVEIQRAAYAIEAELIGFDGIPPLHETAEDVCGLDQLAIHPAWSRQGRGQELVQAVLARAGSSPVTVSTGARNHPACLLYRRMGFRPIERNQIAAGVFVYRFERVAGSGRAPGD